MMPISRSSRVLVAVLVVACGLLAPALAAGQLVPQPRPGAGPSKEKPVPADDCRSVLSGLVFERVGNLLHGPSEPSGLRNIQVQLLDTEDRRVAQTRTGRDGRYAFRKVCAGTYTVCPGTPCPARGPIPSRYEPTEQRVTVPPRLQNGIDFRLTEPPPVRQPPM